MAQQFDPNAAQPGSYEKDEMTIKNAIPKFIALLLITVVVSLLAISTDNSLLAKIDSMTATEYIEAQRKLYHHSFMHHFMVCLIFGGLYVCSVEFIGYVIGLCFKKSPSSNQPN